MKSTKYSDDDVTFLHGSASELDLETKTLSFTKPNGSAKEQLEYDFLVVASGMSRGWPVVPKSLDYETYMKDTEGFEQELSPASRIAVIGGGKLMIPGHSGGTS